MTPQQKLVMLGLGVWAGTMTLLVIKNRMDINWTIQNLGRVVQFLDQKQYDEAFVHIVENLDDPEN